MDFFAAGGFQQLLCDLDERMSEDVEEIDIFHSAYAASIESLVLKPAEKSYHTVGGEGYYNYYELLNIEREDDEANFTDISNNRRDLNNNDSRVECRKAEDSWEYSNQQQEQQLENKEIANLNDLESTDQNYVLEDYLLFPSTKTPNNKSNNPQEPVQEVEAEDPTLLRPLSFSSDIADWEEKFLDNYIELPELSECLLSEKTPLCTDTCEHFLEESCQNLQLFTPSPGPSLSESPSSPSEGAVYSIDKGGYPCTFGTCDKIYAKPAHLKAHMRRHLGEKPYVCTWTDCKWKFSRSDELARHRRSHSGVKPYKCDYCMKCFARSDHLTKHRKVHERRMLAASKSGAVMKDGVIPISVLTVRPGRKRKNQF